MILRFSLSLLVAAALLAQQGPRPPGRQGPPRMGRGKMDQPGMERPRRPPFPPWFDDLAKMSPEDRRKALEDNPGFRQLSPERQEQVRRRLEDFSAISPKRRAMMRDRWEIMSSLSEEGRQRVREVFPQWNHLPEDRRKAVGDEFRAMRGRTAAERDRRFSDPEFLKNFSPTEQQLLKDLTGLLK